MTSRISLFDLLDEWFCSLKFVNQAVRGVVTAVESIIYTMDILIFKKEGKKLQGG
jgi:hypothetical protein